MIRVSLLLLCIFSFYAHGSAFKVAVYDDDGVWPEGLKHLKWFLTHYQMDYETLSANEISSSILSAYDILVMPGGESWTYLDSLGKKKGEVIKEFVAKGGGYIGICAGAFYGVSHREGGHTTGPYGIGLINGVAYDGTSLGTPPFKDGMLDFSVDLAPFPEQMRIVLFEGPSFLIAEDEMQARQVQVIARFPEIGHPAMLLFRHGLGRVFMTGPHPEIEEHRTNWGSEFNDPESDWPLLHRMFMAVLPQQL